MLVNLVRGGVGRGHPRRPQGHFAPLRHAAAYWRDRAKAGEPVAARVVNTSSGAGLMGSVGQSNYARGQGRSRRADQVAAAELARYGVTVNAIAPSARTAMTEIVFADAMRAARGAASTRWPRRTSPRWSSGSPARTPATSPVGSSRSPAARSASPTAGSTARPIDAGRRWRPDELGPVVRDLIAQGAQRPPRSTEPEMTAADEICALPTRIPRPGPRLAADPPDRASSPRWSAPAGPAASTSTSSCAALGAGARRRRLDRPRLAARPRRARRQHRPAGDLLRGVRPGRRPRPAQPHRRVPARADPHRVRHRRSSARASCRRSPRADRAVVPGLLRARRRLRPRRRAHPRRAATATSGGSPARRCGRRWRTSPTGASCWPAPTPTRPSSAGCPTCSCRWTSPASRSGRSCRSPGRRSSTRSSSTARSPPPRTSSARPATAGGWPPAPSRFERGVATLGQQLGFARELDAVSPRAREQRRLRRPGRGATAVVDAWVGLQTPAPPRAAHPGHAERAVPGVEASVAKLLWAPWHQRLGELAMDVGGPRPTIAGRRSTSPTLQRLFLFTRADTIYGGSNEIQRNIIADRLLGRVPRRRERSWIRIHRRADGATRHGAVLPGPARRPPNGSEPPTASTPRCGDGSRASWASPRWRSPEEHGGFGASQVEARRRAGGGRAGAAARAAACPPVTAAAAVDPDLGAGPAHRDRRGEASSPPWRWPSRASVDPAAASVRRPPDGDGYRSTGSKSTCSTAQVADWWSSSAVCDGRAGPVRGADRGRGADASRHTGPHPPPGPPGVRRRTGGPGRHGSRSRRWNCCGRRWRWSRSGWLAPAWSRPSST